MPVWMEILINVIGYAGFIVIATYHKSPGEKLPDAEGRRPVGSSRGVFPT